MIARREVFDVAVVARQEDGRSRQVNAREHFADEAREVAEHSERALHVTVVPHAVGDEVLVEREAVPAGDSRENVGGLFGRAKGNVLAALDEETVREVVEERAARA